MYIYIGTEIVIPVTALVQCPDQDVDISVQIAGQVARYEFRHAWQVSFDTRLGLF
jgi:hypothetical protein